jgi:hypothetical protein
MVLTGDWRKDVCRLIREADLADIKRHDDALGYYANDQRAIVAAIVNYRMHGTPMGRNEIEYVVSMQMQNTTKSWDRLQALVDSICSRLAIEF